MQKTDFLTKLDEIGSRLQSQKIVDILRTGLLQPGNVYDYAQVIPILFESKSQFDQLMKDPSTSAILKQITGIEVYSEKSLSSLSQIFRTTHAGNLLTNSVSVQFISLHNSLTDLLKLSSSLLSNQYINNNTEQNLDIGIIIFEIRIESEGLGTSSYIKILSALEDLSKTLEKVFKLEVSEPTIVMLDSGSDTDFAMSTKIEIAKSLFQIFKEIWDYITSFRFYRAHQRNQVLLESLSIRQQILKSVEEGILTDTEAKEYLHIIKTRTDELIGMKVLPRDLVFHDKSIDPTKILEEYRAKFLEERNE
jgi:hypothetical protein